MHDIYIYMYIVLYVCIHVLRLCMYYIDTNKWLVKGRFPEHITVQSGPGRWQKVDVDNGSNSRVGVERLCLQSLHVIDDSVLILAGSRILFR